MNNIEISYENINTELDNKIIVKICNNILKLLEVDNWEISIVFCNDPFIRELNRDYRNKDEATDVLSFPQIEGEQVPDGENSLETEGEGIIESEDLPEWHDIPEFAESPGNDSSDSRSFYAGDIIISLDTVEKNSKYFNVDKNEELIRLLILGILHLYGMTHESNDPDQEMLIKQEELLNAITGVIKF